MNLICPDIDIDFADRTHLLKHVKGVGRIENGNKHNTGVYQ